MISVALWISAILLPLFTMKLDIFQIDAFARQLFSGNPAAVIPLSNWLDEEMMQQLAMENNLSETVFFVPSASDDADYDIRWFTPVLEIDLCGHATMASAWVLFNRLGFSKPEIRFSSRSGILTVKRQGEKISLDFPSWHPQPLHSYNPDAVKALGNPAIKAVFKYRDLLLELENEEAVRSLRPDFSLLKTTGEKVIVTAAGRQVDFVSRFFAPAAGVDEDPVTGSAHAQLIPYWAARLGKDQLHALQLSPRGGELWCEQKGHRVSIAGECAFYMKGEISI